MSRFHFGSYPSTPYATKAKALSIVDGNWVGRDTNSEPSNINGTLFVQVRHAAWEIREKHRFIHFQKELVN